MSLAPGRGTGRAKYWYWYEALLRHHAVAGQRRVRPL